MSEITKRWKCPATGRVETLTLEETRVRVESSDDPMPRTLLDHRSTILLGCSGGTICGASQAAGGWDFSGCAFSAPAR